MVLEDNAIVTMFGFVAVSVGVIGFASSRKSVYVLVMVEFKTNVFSETPDP